MENAFGILVSRLGYYWAPWSKGRRLSDIVLAYVVLHNMLRTYQDTADRAPTPANDVAALRNEQVVYVPDDNYWNPSRKARHQRDLMKDYFNHLGALAGSYPGRWELPWGQKKLASISPSQDYPTFI